MDVDERSEDIMEVMEVPSAQFRVEGVVDFEGFQGRVQFPGVFREGSRVLENSRKKNGVVGISVLACGVRIFKNKIKINFLFLHLVVNSGRSGHLSCLIVVASKTELRKVKD